MARLIPRCADDDRFYSSDRFAHHVCHPPSIFHYTYFSCIVTHVMPLELSVLLLDWFVWTSQSLGFVNKPAVSLLVLHLTPRQPPRAPQLVGHSFRPVEPTMYPLGLEGTPRQDPYREDPQHVTPNA